MKRRCRDEITNEDRAPCCQASNFPYTIPIFERCLVEAIGDLYATPTDFWRPGIAGRELHSHLHTQLPLIKQENCYSCAHISWHELVLAGNQGNHQKLVPFINFD